VRLWISTCVNVSVESCGISTVITSAAGGSPPARTLVSAQIDTAVTTPSSACTCAVDLDVRQCVCGELRHLDSDHKCCRWLTTRTHAGVCTDRHCRHHSVVCLHVCGCFCGCMATRGLDGGHRVTIGVAGSPLAHTPVSAHIDTAVTTPSSVVMCLHACEETAVQGLDGGCSRLTTHAHAGVRTHRHCRHHSVVCCHVCPCARGDSGARSRRCTRVVQAAHRSHAHTPVPIHIDTAVTTPSSVVMCLRACEETAVQGLDGAHEWCRRLTTSAHAR
jgi:hypothetical protein